jgi:PIN domain nuclease of toxin-antitoxin system
VILDTNVWWRYLRADSIDKRTLKRVERARAAGRLHVAAVTLWEIALLAQEGKLRLDDAVPKWLDTALARSGVTVAALEAGVAYEGARFARLLRDPADCQIAGTAIHLGVPLATRDERMLENAESLGLEVLEA